MQSAQAKAILVRCIAMNEARIDALKVKAVSCKKARDMKARAVAQNKKLLALLNAQ